MTAAARRDRDFLRHLSRVCLMGPWTSAEMTHRIRQALGLRRKLRWAAPLCDLLCFTYPERPGLLEVTRVLETDVGLSAWYAKRDRPASVQLTAVGPAIMAPAMAAFHAWDLPALTNLGGLADWLHIASEELDWFADRHSWERCRTRDSSRHYSYRWLRRASHRWRLIESPRARLKSIQRQILHEVLDRVPAHEAAHGFRAGRSCLTYASPHVGHEIVWKLDLRNFFPNMRRPRIRAVWQTLGYPDDIAEYLSALVTNAVPQTELEAVRAAMNVETFLEWEQILKSPHLPQGAPTSPALANLAAFRLDCRLAGLAAKTGVEYTRYADDLAFSGDRAFAQSLPHFRKWVLAIILDEGFEIRDRKTRTMFAYEQQRLTGLIVNDRPQSPRKDYDELRALLHNCIRFGPQSQNRHAEIDFRAHLLGRMNAISRYSESRSGRLRNLFEQIDWGTMPTTTDQNS